MSQALRLPRFVGLVVSHNYVSVVFRGAGNSSAIGKTWSAADAKFSHKPTPNDKYTKPQDSHLPCFVCLFVSQMACQWCLAMQVIAALLPNRGIAAGVSIGHKPTPK